jgi:F-type H+-transporting ATPase subunit b|tara:strand:- start:41 stop:571 length:531 start_codon:yes stop_codon:yes gene_type:complete
MIYQTKKWINIMVINSTFWVAISFFIFLGGLVYLKVPHKINEVLNKLIKDIENEISESEKLRIEAKNLLDKSQGKLDTAQNVSNNILEQARKDSDHLVIEMNNKFHKSSEIKKKLAENKILQMKDAALKEIKDVSVKIAVESVKKIINTSVDKSKLDMLFDKNLEDTKITLKKVSS